jgi:porin
VAVNAPLLEQLFAEGRGAVYLGLLDTTDYTDAYALASPWQGFANLAFQTGSGTIGGLPDAALGVAAGYFLNDNFYVGAGIVDANADATDPFSDSLFDQGETFKSFEFGWTTGSAARFFNNYHLTFWQIDERKEEGTPEGHGVAFSISHVVDEHWLPFLRGGWAHGGDALYEASISAGFGYSQDISSSLFGFGVNWSRPSEDTFGAKLDEQITVEAFQKWQLTEGIELTPSIQYIRNPALNPEEDSTRSSAFGSERPFEQELERQAPTGLVSRSAPVSGDLRDGTPVPASGVLLYRRSPSPPDWTNPDRLWIGMQN